ncbi:MAG: hypothetical protein ACXV8P_12395 [Methylobacter sp.]
MDWWIVKQLRAMVLSDLREFIPQGYFESEVEKFKLHDGIKNSGHFSQELRWGYLAGNLGRMLFYNSTAIMSARQVSASDVLMNLGILVAAEAMHSTAMQLSKDAKTAGVSDGNAGIVADQLGCQYIPTLSNNLEAALEQYLCYLEPLEAKPFLPLIITRKYPINLNRFSNKVLSFEELKEVIDKILDQFQDLVENKGLWKAHLG